MNPPTPANNVVTLVDDRGENEAAPAIAPASDAGAESLDSDTSHAENGSGPRRFMLRALNYLTNHVVAHIPSFAFRRVWYERVLGIEIGEGAGVHLNCYIWFYGRGGLRRYGSRIGAHSRINRNCTLDFRGGLRIGANVSVSAEAMILTIANLETSRSHGEGRSVVVEDNVWIGARALIMPGVTLGRGSVVAAGSVVTRDVAPLAIVFGVPARPVGARSEDDAEYSLESPFSLFE